MKRLLVLLSFSIPAYAEHVAIVGATIFDATGNPPYAATVLIKDRGIVAIDRTGAVPDNTKVIDASGMALLPGFFDLHVHFTPRGQPATDPQILQAYIEHGVTTVYNFHAPPEAFDPLRVWYEQLPGPNVRFVARMSTSGGHGADWADENTTREVNTPAAATSEVASLTTDYRPDAIKAFADGWRYGSGIDNSSMDEPTLTALVARAHESHVPVLTHTVTANRLALAGRAKVNAIAHSTLDRDLTATEIEALLDGGGSYAGTLAVYDPNKPRATMSELVLQVLRTRFAIGLRNMKALHEAGVPIALGTDAGMPGTPHGPSTLREMQLMSDAGLSATEILLAATANSAKAMGEYDARGSIEVGKAADLVLIEGKPWEDISHVYKVRRTFVGGQTMFGEGAPARVGATHPPPLSLTEAVIDDFDRPDGRTSLGAVRLGDFDMGKERSQQIMVTRQDGKRGNVLTLSGQMAHREDPYIGVILPMSQGAVHPVDASRWLGVSADLRGNTEEIEVSITTTRGRYIYPLPLTSEWSNSQIPFASIPDNGRGKINASNIVSVGMRVTGPGGSKAWLEVDDVRFYE